MKKIFGILLSIVLFCGCTNNKNENLLYLKEDFYKENKLITKTSDEINNLKKDNNTYLVYTYNNYCTMKIPCEEIFKSIMEKNNFSMYSIPFKDFKNTFLYDTVKFAPSVIIVSNGKIIDYLDASKDDDLEKYQNDKEFEKWLKKYLVLEM